MREKIGRALGALGYDYRRLQDALHLILVLTNPGLDLRFFLVIRLQGVQLVAGKELPLLLEKVNLAEELSPGPGDENLGMGDQLGVLMRMGKVAVDDKMDPVNIRSEHFLLIRLHMSQGHDHPAFLL